MRIHLLVADQAAARSLVRLAELFGDGPSVTVGPEPAPDADYIVRLEASETGDGVRAGAELIRRGGRLSPFRGPRGGDSG